MSDATPTPDSTGTAPATPGASAPETPPQALEGSLLIPAKEEAKPEAEKPLTIPDKYEFKLDEGREIDAGLIEAVSPVLKELGLTQEQASKLVTAYDKYGQTFEQAQDKQFKEYMAETTRTNIAAIKKEWGHEFDANLQVAQRGIARFLSDAGKQKLEQLGLANDPEFVKAFYQAGKMIQEDTPPIGQPNGKKPATLAQALYGTPQ